MLMRLMGKSSTNYCLLSDFIHMCIFMFDLTFQGDLYFASIYKSSMNILLLL